VEIPNKTVHHKMIVTPRFLKKFRIRYGILFIASIFLLNFFGVFKHFFEVDFDDKEFDYPYNGDVLALAYQLRHNQRPDIEPINYYNYTYRHNNERKCMEEQGTRDLNPQLVILVKSAMGNFERRNAIRSSWGFERRFSDVLIRTVFLLGVEKSVLEGVDRITELQKLIDLEAEKFNDIVQLNFVDTYFNNTRKTMSGFRWVMENCVRSKFYLFVDDDFYVSVKNILAFLRNPVRYPEYLEEYNEQLRKLNQQKLQEMNLSRNIKISQTERVGRQRRFLLNTMELSPDVKLFAGFVFQSSPHRHMSSKWYVSLEEYRWGSWPRYITAGSFILSREALIEMYYVSLYTKHFR
jgi:hypothetical protein